MGRYTEAKLETLASVLRFMQGGAYPAYPMMVFLESSNFCNLKCVMCPPFSKLNPDRLKAISEQDRGFMPKEFLPDLEEVLAHAYRTPVFGYGETTLNPDLPEFLRLCGKYETMASFFTNGSRLTPELCASIVENRVQEVTVSFSGSTKEEYEAVYEGGVWETTLRGIRELAAQKRERGAVYPRISINSIGYQHHVDRLDEFVDLMADAGADRIILIPLSPPVPQLAHHTSVLRPWVEGQVLERAKAVAAQRGIDLGFDCYAATSVADEADYVAKRQAIFDRLGVSCDDAPMPIADLKRLSVVPATPSDEREPWVEPDEGERPFEGCTNAGELGAEGVFCFEPFYTLYVSRNGDFKPCCNATLPIFMGDLAHEPAVEAWRGTRFGTLRQTILEGGYPSMCHSCVRYEPHPYHNFLITADMYRNWYEGAFNEPLPPEWMEAMVGIAQAGCTQDVVARQRDTIL